MIQSQFATPAAFANDPIEAKRRRREAKIEEHFFNNSFLKHVNGEKRRCGEIIFTETFPDYEVEKHTESEVKVFKSILNRIVGQDKEYPIVGKGKKFITALTERFKKELKFTVSEDSFIGNKLKNKDIGKVSCILVTYGPETCTFEGIYHVELMWYAEYLEKGNIVVRRIVHTYNSKTDKIN